MSDSITNAEVIAKIKAKISKEIKKERSSYDNTSGEIEGLRKALELVNQVVKDIILY